MKKLIIAFGLTALFLALDINADALTPAQVNGCQYNATPPSLADKQTTVVQCDAAGNILVVPSGTPSGTQDVNLKQVGGATTAVGHGVAATALRVELPTDGTGVVGLVAGSAVIGHVITDTGSTTAVTQATAANLNALVVGGSTAADTGVLTAALKTWSILGVYNGTTTDLLRGVSNGMNSTGAGLPVAAQVGQCDDTSPTGITENSWGNARIDCTTHGHYVETLPTASATAGIAAVFSSALETGHVLKNAAGNLYGVAATTTTAAGYLQVFNSTTVPAAGAVTPVATCYVGAFGTCALNFNPPLVLSTGISVAFSASATPFTKTDSATAFLSGQVQ